MHVFLGQLVAWGLSLVGTTAQSNYGPCYRNCERSPPRTCYYKFTEELYATLTGACGNCSDGVKSDCMKPQCVPADGYERSVYTINRQIPGTPIHVCRGDEVVVDLHIKTPGHGETIHWHGLLQKQTPWMDGVSMVTQCPVMQGQTFRYRYKVPDAGTFFYHPHSGLAKPNGASGVLVVRSAHSEDPQGPEYDKDEAEHTVFLSDWMHDFSESVFPGLAKRIIAQPTTNVLINGLGIYTDPVTNKTTKTPMAEFTVKPTIRYRFRLINAGTQSCPISLQIQGHRLTIIASDAEDVLPKTVDTIVSFAGERYDFVVEANQPPKAYWIHAHTTGFCDANPVEQWAVLLYEGRRSSRPTTARPSVKAQPIRKGVILNSPALDCGTPNAVCPTDLRSLIRVPKSVWKGNPGLSRTHVLPFQFYIFKDAELFTSPEYYHFSTIGPLELAAIVNNISFTLPSSPLLTQPRDVEMCDHRHKPEHCTAGGGSEYCHCTHVIKLPLYQTVRIVMVDTTDVLGPALSHPFHLHGYSFWVTGWGILSNITSGQERLQHVQDRLRLGSASGLEEDFGYSTPPKKDVLVVPGYGYTVVRLYTDNPGMWFYHCHFQYHMAIGMELTFQVGEPSDFAPPPRNFPKCGNFF